MLILLLLGRSLQLFKLIFIVTQYRVIKNSGTYQENSAVQYMRGYTVRNSTVHIVTVIISVHKVLDDASFILTNSGIKKIKN